MPAQICNGVFILNEAGNPSQIQAAVDTYGLKVPKFTIVYSIEMFLLQISLEFLAWFEFIQCG